MKKSGLLFSLLVFLVTSGFSQNNWDNDKTNKFIGDLYMNNMKEIQISQLTFTKNVRDDIKKLGLMIVKDHENANMKLQEVAQEMNINLPGKMAAKQRDKVDKFNRLNPVDFEDQYIDFVVSSHQKDIEDLQNARDKIANEQFSHWIDNTLPVMKDHLEAARKLQDMKRWKDKDRTKDEMHQEEMKDRDERH